MDLLHDCAGNSSLTEPPAQSPATPGQDAKRRALCRGRPCGGGCAGQNRWAVPFGHVLTSLASSSPKSYSNTQFPGLKPAGQRLTGCLKAPRSCTPLTQPLQPGSPPKHWYRRTHHQTDRAIAWQVLEGFRGSWLRWAERQQAGHGVPT